MLAMILSLDDALIEYSDSFNPTADAVENLSVREILGTVRNTLSPEEYHILTRTVFEQVSRKKLAQEMGISVAACQKRLERVRKKLGTVFPEYTSKK